MADDIKDALKELGLQSAGGTGSVNHLLGRQTACPKCCSTNMKILNYDPSAHDGDVHCSDCGTYVRMYDAG